MGFTKLDQNILQSSIMAANPKTFKVWISLLAAAGPDGIARVAPTFLARVCFLRLKDVEKTLEELASPDPKSRTGDEEGRRIKKVDGGYLILNYQKYRESKSDTPEAKRFRRHYQRMKSVGPNRKTLDLTQPNAPNVSSYVEAEAEAEAEEEEKENTYVDETSTPVCQKDDQFKSWCNSIISQWNEFAQKTGLPAVRGVVPGSKRERLLRGRFKDKEFDFPKILEKVSQSKFLLGLTSDWRVSFDWLICPSNYIKVLEENYLDQTSRLWQRLKKWAKEDENDKQN